MVTIHIALGYEEGHNESHREGHDHDWHNIIVTMRDPRRGNRTKMEQITDVINEMLRNYTTTL